jgi:small subunit ribosomal protein S24e
MEIEIEGRHKNTFFHREEVNFEILNIKKTPSRAEVRKALAVQLGAGEELIVVDEINHEFGSTCVVGFAKRYDTIEDLKKTEPMYMRARHGEKDEKAAAPTKGEGA